MYSTQEIDKKKVALIALAVVTVVLIAVYFTGHGHVGLESLMTHTTSTYTTPTGVTH
jgi:Na+/melibiose symporter-like transporter